MNNDIEKINTTDEMVMKDENLCKIEGEESSFMDIVHSEKHEYPHFRPTASQLQIIKYPANQNEILSIKSGPGSGKTSTIVERIAYLIDDCSFKPQEILVLSMANRSVKSLRDSLKNRSGDVIASQLNISTFHSFCGSLVENYAEQYMSNFTKKRIMDDLSWRNFSNIFSGSLTYSKGNKSYNHSKVPNLESLIIGIRNGELDFKDTTKKFNIDEGYIKTLIRYLDTNGMMRYHDLITNCVDLIKKSLKEPEDSSKWISQLANYKVVIVDEFQDMHPHLLQIVQQIATYPTYESKKGNFKHLTIAGDPNQCIYEFLGSNPGIMANIEQSLVGYNAKELQIEDSFRLTPEILKMISEVCCTHNGLSVEPSFKSVKPSEYYPIIQTFKSESEEYDFIVDEISRLICESGGFFKPSDFIILARSNHEIEQIRKHLEKNGFQYNKFSSSSSWIKSKVHIFLDILNVINKGQGSDFGLLCVILLLDSKVGSRKRVSKLFDLSYSFGKNENTSSHLEDYIVDQISQLEKNIISQIKVTSKEFASIYKMPDHSLTVSLIKEFMVRVSKERKHIKEAGTPTSIMEALLRVLEGSVLMKYLNTPPKKGRISKPVETEKEYKHLLEMDLIEFFTSLENSYHSYINSEKRDISFLEYFLMSYNDEIPILNSDSVNISTVHTAKGLEFPVVFIVGASKYSRSSWESLLEKHELIQQNETARLFYVACTRARNLLYLGTSIEFNNLPEIVSKNFTNEVPNLTQKVDQQNSLLQKIALDLGRELPRPSRILEGISLYKGFKTDSLSKNRHAYPKISNRSFHTKSLSSFSIKCSSSLYKVLRAIRK